MILLAVDPGTDRSAAVLYDDGTVLAHDTLPNDEVLALVGAGGPDLLVVEHIESYGMAVGREVFRTVWWSGRFVEAAEHAGTPWAELPRREVKLALCQSARARDANVRQALIDRFPGPLTPSGRPAKGHALHGVKGDEWAALGVAVTYSDRSR